MKKLKMKYFSMFTGIGGFDLALNRQGHKCIGYSEIDKYAIQIYEKNFGKEVINYEDATKIEPRELPNFDFLCGGFPCQAFSIAGKRKGFEDTRGTLFFEIARILKAKRPKHFLLENVKGLLNHDKGKTFATIIQTLEELGYDFEWMVLNSKFFGVPQNRERVFIIGSLRGQPRSEILPFRENDSKFYVEGETESPSSKISGTLRAQYYKNSADATYVNEIDYAKKSKAQHSRIYNTEGISPTLAGASKLSGDCTPKIVIPILTPNRENKRQNGRRFKEDGEPSFTLTKTDVHGVIIQSHSPRCGNPQKGGTGLLESSEHCFTLDSSPHYVNCIRRLTPTECERLQGFPNGWTEGLSDTQRYKTLGNAVTVNVIEAIVKRLNLNDIK